MPSGGRQVRYGDKCKGCDCLITPTNCVHKANRIVPWCIECNKIRYNSVPSRSKEARHVQWLNWKFGLDKHEYDYKMFQQLGGCAICKQACEVRSNLAVDHDHITQEVRDLLCHRCNTVLGMIHDDEDLLIDMIEYLKRHARKTA
jgi:Recombination endonuclease VII